MKINISREIFEGIDSFISDIYTECDIKHQEADILKFLDEKLNFGIVKKEIVTLNTTDISPESDIFLTPKGITPTSVRSLPGNLTSSPSIELTKEYYSLVPIEINLLDKELSEQDELLNAFQSIIKAQPGSSHKKCPRQKPTTLSLRSSHTSKTVKHSNSCDTLIKKGDSAQKRLKIIRDINTVIPIPTSFPECSNKCVFTSSSEPSKEPTVLPIESPKNIETVSSATKESNKTLKSPKVSNADNFTEDSLTDPIFSPDSLICDDHSTSSDYLSATNNCPTGVLSSKCNVKINHRKSNILEMDYNFTTSDSGLETNSLCSALIESCDKTVSENSFVDLTESTIQDEVFGDSCGTFVTQETNPKEGTFFNKGAQVGSMKNVHSIGSIPESISHVSSQSDQPCQIKSHNYQNEPIKGCSKEEKQRQNKEIVILESSSLSSETGSWEPVFYPKTGNEIKDACTNFIKGERKYCSVASNEFKEEIQNAAQVNSANIDDRPVKTTACFIDASSLVDEIEALPIYKSNASLNVDTINERQSKNICSPIEQDWSENDDSLEHCDLDTLEKDPDSIQRDLSYTTFEMSPITEDSLMDNKKSESIVVNKQKDCENLDSKVSSNTIILPDTPNNSIMQLTQNPNIGVVAQMGPKELNQDNNIHVRKVKKCDESSPIVSGGASVEDFGPMFSAKNSPKCVRKTEAVPIVSGGFVVEPREKGNKSKVSRSFNTSAWIVDMKDHHSSEKGKQNLTPKSIIQENIMSEKARNLSTGSNGFSDNKSLSSVDSDNSERSSKKSMGFFVDISNMPDAPPPKQEQPDISTDKKNIFSMYIELESNSSVKEMPSRLSSSLNSRKKLLESNMASNKKPTSLKSLSSSNETLKTSPCNKVNESKNMSQTSDKKSNESLNSSLTLQSTLLRKKPDLHSNKNSSLNRHSWNAVATAGDSSHPTPGDYKRTQSLTLSHPMSNIAKTKSKDSVSDFTGSPMDDYTYSKSEISSFSGSSNSRRQSDSISLPALADDQIMQIYENVGASIGDGLKADSLLAKKRRHEVKLNETFDKSSTCSTGTDTEDITYQIDTKLPFEEIEKMCEAAECEKSESPISNVVSIMENDVEGVELDLVQNEAKKTEVVTKMKSLQAKIEKQKRILAGDDNKAVSLLSLNSQSVDSFVRLSDLDKPLPKLQLDSIKEHIVSNNRMTRSIPETGWNETAKHGMSRSTEVFTSFHSENTLSLGRLFPHLKSEFSKSTPVALGRRTRSPLRITSSSPGEIDDAAWDVSELSSVQSSVCRSNIEVSTTDETSQSSGAVSNVVESWQSRLGEDLLRMFIEEISPDVTVEVAGRRVKAHKCILSSRCQYFAAMLSGGWVESAGNVISLPGFSYNVVHFALCHIYSGASNIPESISIVELATLADMLGLEGLKEVIMYTLKVKYCHHFHKPCSICCVSVLDCLPLTAAYGLDDVYRKILKWITKHFVRIWPTKAFATLPRDLIERCYRQHIIHMSVENVMETVSACGRVNAALPNTRWADTVARACKRLITASAQFASSRLASVFAAANNSPRLIFDGVGGVAIDDCLVAAIERAGTDQLCQAYQFLTDLMNKSNTQKKSPSSVVPNNLGLVYMPPEKIMNRVQVGNSGKIEEFKWCLKYVDKWRGKCEIALIRSAPRAAGVPVFKALDSTLQARLRHVWCLVYGSRFYSNLPVSSTSVTQYGQMQMQQLTMSKHAKSDANLIQNLDKSLENNLAEALRSFDTSGVLGLNNSKQSSLRSTSFGTRVNGSVHQSTTKIPRAHSNPPLVRTTNAQQQRSKFNATITAHPSPNVALSSRPRKFENTRPRYLDPKPNREKLVVPTTTMNSPVQKKKVSSSDSSRNSSPALARASQCRTSRAKTRELFLNTESTNNREVCEEKNSQEASQSMSHDSLACSPNPGTMEMSIDSLSESQCCKYGTYTKTKPVVADPVLPNEVDVKSTAKPPAQKDAKKVLVISKTRTTNHTVVQGNHPLAPTIKSANSSPLLPRNTNKVVPKPNNIKPKMSPLTNQKKPMRVMETMCAKKVSGSLMNATKSSSAKMVTKTPMHSPCIRKTAVKQLNGSKKNSPRTNEEIPLMERSGTFLKDESSFLVKTTEFQDKK